MRDPDGFRGFHDWVLLGCAVLSGHQPTILAAAENAAAASARAKRNQYFGSLSGIVRAHILGQPKDEQSQLAIFEQFKPGEPFAYPSRDLVRSFVRRDYAHLATSVVEGAGKHWSDKFLGKNSVVVKDEPDRVVMDLYRKGVYWLWAYPEAVFAKLAILDGATITHDDFWFPLAFVSAVRGGERRPADRPAAILMPKADPASGRPARPAKRANRKKAPVASRRPKPRTKG